MMQQSLYHHPGLMPAPQVNELLIQEVFSSTCPIEGCKLIRKEKACKFLDENWSPKFVVIVAQKNHHTKFFQHGAPENVPPGF